MYEVLIDDFIRLTGRSDYKLRVGDYRVIADLNDATKRIEVTHIGKRDRVYEGPKGIDTIQQDVLSTAKKVLAYGSYAITGKLAKYQSLDFRKRRIKLQIPIIVITDESASEIEMLKDKKYKRLTRIYIDPALAQMPTWTYIYENKVATLLFEREQFFSLIIESPPFVKKERFLFNMLMQQANPLN